MRPAAKAGVALDCPSCGAKAEQVLSAPNFGFAHSPDGPAPQNTGVSDLDHDYDRAIGRDAERQWAAVAVRQDRKLKVMAETGADGEDLSGYDLDGEGRGYFVMKPEERKAAETARELHHDAVAAIKKHAQGKNYLSGTVAE